MPSRSDLTAVRRLVPTLAIAAVLAHAAHGAEPAPSASRAVESFGQALIAADAGALRTLLPAKGRVRLELGCVGAEQGMLSPRQVEALLIDFLTQGSIRTFRVVRVEQDPRGGALARAKADGTDRNGRPVSLELHLALQSEDGRWVLREIRESPS